MNALLMVKSRRSTSCNRLFFQSFLMLEMFQNKKKEGKTQLFRLHQEKEKQNTGESILNFFKLSSKNIAYL